MSLIQRDKISKLTRQILDVLLTPSVKTSEQKKIYFNEVWKAVRNAGNEEDKQNALKKVIRIIIKKIATPVYTSKMEKLSHDVFPPSIIKHISYLKKKEKESNVDYTMRVALLWIYAVWKTYGISFRKRPVEEQKKVYGQLLRSISTWEDTTQKISLQNEKKTVQQAISHVYSLLNQNPDLSLVHIKFTPRTISTNIPPRLQIKVKGFHNEFETKPYAIHTMDKWVKLSPEMYMKKIFLSHMTKNIFDQIHNKYK